MANTMTQVRRSGLADDFLFPNTFAPNRPLSFPVTNAIVTVVGIEGLTDTHRRALMAADDGSASSNRGGSSSGYPERYFMLLQALRNDVWNAVQHLSVRSEDVYIHLGSAKELCSDNEIRVVDGKHYASKPTTITQTKLGCSNSNLGFTSTVSLSDSLIGDDHVRSNAFAGGLGPQLVDHSKLQSFNNAAASLTPVYPVSGLSNAVSRQNNMLKNSNDLLLIIVIKVDGRTDTPVILSSLRAACAPATNYHNSSTSAIGDSTSASTSFFRRSTRFLISMLRSPSISSHRLVPILHSCQYGGAAFAPASSGTNFGVTAAKQRVVDRLVLESLPYVSSSNRVEDAVCGVRGGSLGDLLSAEITQSLNGTHNIAGGFCNSGSEVDPAPTVTTFTMDDVHAFFHEQQMRDLERQLADERRDHLKSVKEVQQLESVRNGNHRLTHAGTSSRNGSGKGYEPRLSLTTTSSQARALQVQRDPNSTLTTALSAAAAASTSSLPVEQQQVLRGSTAPATSTIDASAVAQSSTTPSYRRIAAPPPLPTSRGILQHSYHDPHYSDVASPTRDNKAQYNDLNGEYEAGRRMYVAPSNNVNVSSHRGTVPLFAPSLASVTSRDNYNPYMSGQRTY